jgi:quercetin dioxygenase-like cupin family protein
VRPGVNLNPADTSYGEHVLAPALRRRWKGDPMQITRSNIDTQKGPADWFTGDVYIDAVAAPAGSSTFAAAGVHFAPGARTAWHTHPLGQTLIVTFGRGWAQREGGSIEEIRPGDVIWFEPGEKHWHGATTTTAMTHIAIQEALDGKAVEWMEKVSDEQYQRGLSAR